MRYPIAYGSSSLWPYQVRIVNDVGLETAIGHHVT
jgi:hypothetical protein